MKSITSLVNDAKANRTLKSVKAIKHNLPNDMEGKLQSKRDEAFNLKVNELNLKEVPARSVDERGREHINYKPKQGD